MANVQFAQKAINFTGYDALRIGVNYYAHIFLCIIFFRDFFL